jgi:hypothetical protein
LKRIKGINNHKWLNIGINQIRFFKKIFIKELSDEVLGELKAAFEIGLIFCWEIKNFSYIPCGVKNQLTSIIK